jgi:dihydrofolate reductase
MSGVIWHVTLSLDGFVSGPDHDVDWSSEQGEYGPFADEVMAATGAILAGRRWYDFVTARRDGVADLYGGAWKGPVYVLTHRPAHDPAATFLSGPIEDAVATAKAAAGGKAVGLIGADVARQAVEAGLVDEIVVHLAPILLGAGTRLYTGKRTALERTALHEAPQLTDLRFRPRPAPAATAPAS